jgi:nitrite reductase (NADH) small subunit
LDAIPAGEGRTFDVHGKKVTVVRTRADEVFAMQAECPHKGGPLADGLVGGATLVCPLHGWKFDLRSGQALVGECGLATYPVRLDPNGVVVLTAER